MCPLDNPQGGYGYAAEFQSSALPWVTSSVISSSPQLYSFNYISRFISLTNLDSTNNLAFGFTLNGINGSNKGTIKAGQTLQLELRCTKLWVSGTSGQAFSLIAGLTTVPAGQMPLLTGSFPDGTAWAGVG